MSASADLGTGERCMVARAAAMVGSVERDQVIAAGESI